MALMLSLFCWGTAGVAAARLLLRMYRRMNSERRVSRCLRVCVSRTLEQDA
jgi:hypothetical protein